MLSETIYYERLSQARQQLAAWGVEGVLITSPHNRRWLSGFTGSAGRLIVTPSAALLATDSRYWEQATQQAPAFTVWQLGHDREGDFRAVVAAAIAGSGAARLGVEAQHVTLAEYANLAQVEGVEWVQLP